MSSVPWLGEFLTLAVLHLLAVSSPGPDFAVTVRQCLRFGRKAGIGVALGIGVGMSVHVIYTLMGASALLYATPWLLTLVEILAGAYLLYLGVSFVRQALRSPVTGADVVADVATHSTASRQSFRQSFVIGFIANTLNVKAALFLLAVFTTLISASTPMGVKIFYGVWICTMNVVWFTLVSILFTRTRVRLAFLRLGRWVDMVVGGLLGVVSLRLFWGVLSRP